MDQDEKVIFKATPSAGLCRPRLATLFRRGVQERHRHNHDFRTIGVHLSSGSAIPGDAGDSPSWTCRRAGFRSNRA